MAEAERGIRESLPEDKGPAPREIWLEGAVSERARQEFEQLGWRIHENVGINPAP